MQRYFLVLFVFLLGTLSAADGLIVKKSPYSVKVTADHLVTALEAKGMTVFARIDHSANARKAGLKLPPTIVVIFGNPKIGTKLMQCAPTMAIDLPQKMLIRQDANGQVRIAYNDPLYLAKRHHINDCGPVVKKISAALAHFSDAAIMQNTQENRK